MTIRRITQYNPSSRGRRMSFIVKFMVMGRLITIDDTIPEEPFFELEVNVPESTQLPTPPRTSSSSSSVSSSSTCCGDEDWETFVEQPGKELGFDPLNIAKSPSPEDIAMCISRHIIPAAYRVCPSAPTITHATVFRQAADREMKIRANNILYAENWPGDAALYAAGYPLAYQKDGLGVSGTENDELLGSNALTTAIHPRESATVLGLDM